MYPASLRFIETNLHTLYGVATGIEPGGRSRRPRQTGRDRRHHLRNARGIADRREHSERQIFLLKTFYITIIIEICRSDLNIVIPSKSPAMRTCFRRWE